MADKIRVEVAYALPYEQIIKTIETDKGITVEQAIVKSGLLDQFSEINLKINKVGIFGQLCKLDKVLQDQDRVEIYRTLIADAKEIRKQRSSL